MDARVNERGAGQKRTRRTRPRGQGRGVGRAADIKLSALHRGLSLLCVLLFSHGRRLLRPVARCSDVTSGFHLYG